MLILKNNINLEKGIAIFYFAVAAVEIIAELFSCKPILFIFKPLISIILMILYWNSSNQRNWIFFAAISFSLITNVFFIPNTEKMLFLGLIAFFIHRLLVIYYIIQLKKLRDFIPILIAIVPFLFFYFYLLSISTEISTNSYIILIFQNILISIIGGIVLSDYVMCDDKKDTWLFIFGLLSVTQYFIVFIEKYYLSDLAPSIFRPLAMVLNVTVYYSFYRFVIEIEKQKEASKLTF